MPVRVLLLEDSADDADLLAHELARAGFDSELQRVETEAQYLAALDSPPDVVLADFSLPGFNALEALRRLRERGLDTPFIVVTGSLQDEALVECLKHGASDCLLKDRLARLGPAVTRALADKRESDERALLEDQLRHAQRLESVGRLAGGVAHDFNNLLTVIDGYADLALAELHPADPVRIEIGEIKRAADRAATLTRQLLAFSRKQVLDPRVLQLNDVVSGMASMLRRLIGEDVKLLLHLAPDLWHVRADPGQLEQVIVNLAVNARDAMPSGGTLTIETQSVDLDESHAATHLASRPGPHVMLALSDTGVGMDAATQERLFEPFFTTKPPGKGTGLGLATVHGIVRQSEGTVWVYSEPGHGTTFKIYLPRFDGPADVAAPKAVSTTPRGSETVLVAEDEDAVRALVVRVLGHHGYSVLEARDGSDALHLLEEHDGGVDLLVSDVVMPGMNGRELYARAQARHQGLRVLYLSGYTENAIVHSGVLDPGVAFLPKPFRAESLLRKVREVLDEPRPS